jgi:squalene-hopene/tetraprenyl-beta-curcumene cyclase
MIDPSTADITARILEMLAAYGCDQSHPQVRKAIRYLLLEQKPDGSWFGRWGVNYIYGTWQVLKGLTAIGLPTDHPGIRRGVAWLLGCQNSDGGWGETCRTYDCPSEKGGGPSTASQTAWALMGLMAAGHADSPAVRRGIDILISSQTPDGTWDEEQWTGAGFPRVFYLRYHMYRHTFPLWALGMYSRYQEARQPDLRDAESGRALV